MAEQRRDLILYGATGFTGRLAARWLAAHAPAGLRWAVAGRRADALNALVAELGAPVDTFVADSRDAAAIEALVSGARVVLSTAGPFALHGELLVAACARQGVHYADITGESPYVRRLIDRYHEGAAETGAKIVPFCGFDSVPADLGALMMVRALAERGEGTASVTAAVLAKGGFNGGTLASMLELAKDDLGALADPVLLNPEEARTDTLRQANPDLSGPLWSEPMKTWLAPFFMAPVNTRVVRRSAALAARSGNPYGSDFRYQEGLEMKGFMPRFSSWSVARLMGGFNRVVATGWGRDLVARLGPKPGEGPSEAVMRDGFMRYRYAAVGERGTTLLGRLSYAGDPGNHATVAMLGCSGLCLALDGARLPPGGGVLTPASAIGLALRERMVSAGFEISID